MNRSFGWPEFFFIVAALRWTAALSAVAFAGGAVLGLLVAVARSSPLAPLRWVARGYIELFQGTPVLMQLFVAYYGLAVLLNLRIDPWPAVALALVLHTAAFLGEIWRGSIDSIPKTQWESAECLALSYPAQLRYVILPQAMRISIPATVGFLVQLIKSTAIASIIGFVELTRAGQIIVNVTFQPMTVYPVVAALYFALCWPLSMASEFLERRIDVRAGGLRHL
ncbi:MAG: amino acid ABC transporter permease [Acidisphaera sp.]|nr:amino acid ABC transporter permease [Acidisphaera sp.]